MSWKQTSVMKEKMKFIRAWQSDQYSISALCDAFGISRTTGHKLIRRFREEGEKCFELRSKRPKSVPHKTPAKIEKAIIRLREKHKNWGARKFAELLKSEFNVEEIPSETTINAILSRNGLVKKRGKRPTRLEKLHPKYESKHCNEIWSVDYKGKFRLGNKKYCHPLTIQDKKSRFIISCDGHYVENFENVKRSYVKAFRTFGKPLYMHSDNGIPFGQVRSVKRFTKLSYWLIDHGIMPLYSDTASPQQNGKHERMHRDLKAYCTKPPKHTLTKQQFLLDEFKDEYNSIRPHESLNMKTPDSIYVSSDREYKSGRFRDYEYEPNMKVHTVMKNGAIRYGAYNWLFVSRAAIRRKVAMQEVGNGIYNLYYRNVLLGYFDIRKFERKEQYLHLSKPIV